MANVILNKDFEKISDENDNEIDINNDIYNYKGYFLENKINEEEGPKYYEYGAHFPYLVLYQKLEILAEKEKEEKNKNNNLLDNKELNEETDIFAYFSHNTKKSRNKNNNNDNFTKQPFLNYNFNNNDINEKNEIKEYCQKIRTYVESNKKINEDNFLSEKNKKNKIKREKNNTKKKYNNISALISHNKYKEKAFNFFEKNLIENMNLYTSFAKKLKMNRHFNFSKKDSNNGENSKNSNSNKKIKSIQINKEKININ